MISGSLWLAPNDYSIRAANLEFLTDAPSVQASYAYSQSGGPRAASLAQLDDFYMAVMPDKQALVIDGAHSFLFNPTTREFSQLSMVDLKTVTDGDITGTAEGQVSANDSTVFGRYNNIVIGQDVWQVGGFNIKAISPDGTRNYPLDINPGYMPLVVKLSDTELLIAGAARSSGSATSITSTNDLNDPNNKSKLFKYNIKTRQLSDTGKLTPALFGGSDHFTTYHDFGDRVLIWERSSGGVYLLNKRTLRFKQVADGIQKNATSQSGAKLTNLIYHPYPVNSSLVLFAPQSLTIDDAVYLYDRHSNQLNQLTLSAIADSHILSRARLSSSTGKISDIKYIPIVSGGRFLSLMPYQLSGLSGQLQDLWNHRIVLDLVLRRFVDVENQSIKMKAGLVKNDNVRFWAAWPLSTGWSWLAENSGQTAVYWTGVGMAPLSWLTWQQLDYTLSFVFLSLLIGGVMLLYLRRKTVRSLGSIPNSTPAMDNKQR